MSLSDASAAKDAVERLADRLASDPHLRTEMQRARREFFPTPTAGAGSTAELRFREWFVCERESELLGAVPLTLPIAGDDADDLADSQAGLWLVQHAADGAASGRDLQDDTVVDFVVPPGTLQAGDLVVGRLFAMGAGRCVPSIAAAIFRPGAELAQAFARDLERLQLDRRLLQVELEHLLLQRPGQVARQQTEGPTTPPLEHLEADLEALLRRTTTELDGAELSQRLAVAVRPGSVIGPVLDELAFDTDVDLDAVRALLLQIWNAHHPEEASVVDAAPEPSTAPGESLGERLARTLDEGLAQKRDVGDLFAQLERMAGIEPEADDEADRDDGVGEDEAAATGRVGHDDQEEPTGNLVPLVEEYLWETERVDDPAAGPLRLFARLQQNAAVPHADLEAITPTDILRSLLHIYLGAPPDQRAAAVRFAFTQLRAFCAWAETTQELQLGGVLDGVRGALLEQLDRLQAAGQALSTPAAAGTRAGIVTIDEIGSDGFGASDDDGDDHWLAVAPQALAWLRVGDLVLGALQPARTGVRETLAGLVVVLPADARSLIE